MSEEDFNRRYNPHLIGLNSNVFRNIPGKQSSPVRRPANVVYQSNFEFILSEASRIKNEIVSKIKNSKQLDAFVVRDIKPLVDKYILQIQEVIERDKYISRLLNGTSIKEMDRQINTYIQKASETDNPKIKYEYQNAIQKMENQKKAIKELEEEKEILQLRLNSTIMTLDQIKFDLLRIENLASEE